MLKAASRQIDRGNRRPLVMDTIGKNSQEGPALKVQVAKSPACLFHLLEHAENLASTRLASFNRTNAKKRQPISLPSKTGATVPAKLRYMGDVAGAKYSVNR